MNWKSCPRSSVFVIEHVHSSVELSEVGRSHCGRRWWYSSCLEAFYCFFFSFSLSLDRLLGWFKLGTILTRLLAFLLEPLVPPLHDRLVRQPAALSPRETAGPYVVVVLADPAARVLRLEALEAVARRLGVLVEKRVTERVLRLEPLFRVVLEEGGQEVEAFLAEHGEGVWRAGGCRLRDGGPVPLFQEAVGAETPAPTTTGAAHLLLLL